MADIKVLYINADGLRQEHSESADSIKMASLKTANNELTDAKLGNLIGGVDANDEHIHDARYYQESEFINVSAGAGDAGKPAVLDASGKWDSSMIDFGAVDHGGLTGLGDDDHTQYSLVDGTRAYTGVVAYNSQPTFNNDLQIVSKKYVDDVHTGDEWYPDSAIDYITDNTAVPPTEVADDVYVLAHDGGAPHANWDGASAGDIVKFNGTIWVATTPTTGTKISIDDETDGVRLWTGSQWDQKFYESTTASTGLTKVGVDIRLDSSSAGDGLGFLAGVLNVNVDDSTIETNTDTLRVKADGINDTHIDFGTGANQVSGADIPLVDAGAYYPTDDVESVLQYIGQELGQQGESYTVGVGGVSAGDLVYLSGANTVLPYSTLTNSHRGIGLALTTETAAATVKVLANDTRIDGLTIAGSPSVGDPIYWDGSQLTATIPSGGGSHVWQAGVLADTGDVHVEVRHVKKNA